MFDVNDDVFTEEDFYLCKMFGEDCRFVEVSGVRSQGEISSYNNLPVLQSHWPRGCAHQQTGDREVSQPSLVHENKHFSFTKSRLEIPRRFPAPE